MQPVESPIGDQILVLLQQIASLYQDEIMLTLITRSLNSPDGSRDTMISNDQDLHALEETLRRLWRQRPAPDVTTAVKRELNG